MSSVHENPFGTPDLPARGAFAPPDPPERPEGAPERPQPDRWPVWTAFVALLAGWLGGSVLGGIVYAVASAQGYSTSDAPIGYDLLANLMLDGALVAAAVGFARFGGVRVTPASFGLRPPARFWRAVGWAVVGYVAYIVVSAVWINALGLHNEKDEITKRLSDHPTTATVAGMAVFAVVIAPIVEELFFRGFVFPALRSKLNVGLAAVGTGLMFGAVHVFGSPVGFLVPLAVLGTVLCLVYWKSGSLYPCIALHAINNCIALSSTLDWDWQVPLLIAGSLGAISAIVLPVSRLGRRPAAAA